MSFYAWMGLVAFAAVGGVMLGRTIEGFIFQYRSERWLERDAGAGIDALDKFLLRAEHDGGSYPSAEDIVAHLRRSGVILAQWKEQDGIAIRSQRLVDEAIASSTRMAK